MPSRFPLLAPNFGFKPKVVAPIKYHDPKAKISILFTNVITKFRNTSTRVKGLQWSKTLYECHAIQWKVVKDYEI